MELVTVDLSSFSVVLPVNEEFSHLGASFPGFSTVRATPQLDSHNPILADYFGPRESQGFPW